MTPRLGSTVAAKRTHSNPAQGRRAARLHRKHLRRHGQALVLFGLFLLFLTVMVMATLSLSHITHAKMEMQVASDTAAYSQAVASARAFNSVALLNRAQVATMVAVSGVDSAISFASEYRAAINAVWYSYADEWDAEYCGGFHAVTYSEPTELCEGNRYDGKADCTGAAHGLDGWDHTCYGPACVVSEEIFGWGTMPDGTPSSMYTGADNSRFGLMRPELERIQNVWQSLDEAAGTQAKMVQSEAIVYGGLQKEALDAAQAKLRPFTESALSVTGATVNDASLVVANREYDDAYGDGDIDNSLYAGMGSRANTFITERSGGQAALPTADRPVLGPSGGAAEVTLDALVGNGYFATNQIHGARPASGFAAWGDDHSTAHVDYAGPGRFLVNGHVGSSGSHPFHAWVRSTDLQNTADQHSWCPADFKPEAVPPDERHTMLAHLAGTCKNSSCIWPSFYDSNGGLVDDRGDIYGQPKLFASATHDLTQRDPWNMFFRFKLMDDGDPATTVDLKNMHAVHGVVPKLQSVSAAVAYYHRPGHWNEPPTLFNPYWRAGLVRANIDDPGLSDARSAVSSSNAAAIGELQAVGFKGIP